MSLAIVPITQPVPTRPTDQNPAACYLAKLAPGHGRRVQAEALETIARILSGGRLSARELPWEQVRYQHVVAVRTFLQERYRPATVNRMLSALRGVLKEAWRLGLMDAESYSRAVDVQNVRGSSIPAGREIEPGELIALFAACARDSSPAGARDAAMLALLYAGGLRRAEIVALDLEDVDPETGRVVVRGGKGRKERVVWLANGALSALRDWLAIRGAEPGPLFWPVKKGGQIAGRWRISTQAVYRALVTRAAEAGCRHCSPHDMRRSFVSHLLNAGADIAVVAKLAGHANVQTTARYDRRSEEVKRQAASLLHVPYRGRA